jgi:hypothetical protein
MEFSHPKCHGTYHRKMESKCYYLTFLPSHSPWGITQALFPSNNKDAENITLEEALKHHM